MNLEAIKDAADFAETYPGSGELNWGEVSFDALASWVRQHPFYMSTVPTKDFDVESVKRMFESWWQAECKKGGEG